MSPNSFTAAPGEMPYDDAPKRVNATCPQCGTDYWRGRDDDGFLCDRCCQERDADAEYDRAQRLKAAG